MYDGGYVTTEFWPGYRHDVPGNPGTISCAEGHHVAEGMWLRDSTVVDDMLMFWYEKAGALIYEYSEWIGWSAARRHARVGNATFGARLLDGMVRTFEGNLPRYLYNTTEHQCWWQIDDRDGMEVSISGSGCRPTINAILFGNAEAIVQVATNVGNTTTATKYKAWAEFAQKATMKLWNPSINSFAVLSLPPPPGQNPPASLPNDFVQNSTRCNLDSVRTPHALVGVRELLGFVPWYFSTGNNPLIPYERGGDFMPMWEQLFDADGFSAAWGLMTAEKR